MNKEHFKKVKEKVAGKIESKISDLHIFDEPRPEYVSKITISDKILEKTFLKLFPYSVRPNFITVFRFVTIPFIIVLLLHEYYNIAFWLFIISAFSDALDGALARTRKQITDWGIVFDPFADKLLIGSVSLILISRFINVYLALFLISIEIFLIVSSYLRFKGRFVPAKTVGKVKMILQSVGLSVLLLAIILQLPVLILISTYILYLAVIFGMLSLFVYRSI